MSPMCVPCFPSSLKYCMHRIVPLNRPMKRILKIALILACCAPAIPLLRAQPSPPSQDTQPENQQKQANPQNGPNQQKPASQQKPDAAAQKPTGSNQFPEDTSSIPVVPTSDLPTAQPAPAEDNSAAARLPGEDADPVRSPDDPAPDAKGSNDGFSSSLQGANELKPIPDEEKPGKHSKGTEAPTHTEGVAEDINVGSYYLERKNWRAALSRFESGLVLDPENPEVYWGMAEAQSHLGEYAKARENYEKLLEYDPGGKHAKEARKALKEPQIANAH